MHRWKPGEDPRSTFEHTAVSVGGVGHGMIDMEAHVANHALQVRDQPLIIVPRHLLFLLRLLFGISVQECASVRMCAHNGCNSADEGSHACECGMHMYACTRTLL